MFQLVDACYQAIPPLLLKQGKVKNPYPNVDAHSGQLLNFYNLKEQQLGLSTHLKGPADALKRMCIRLKTGLKKQK